MSQRCHWRTWRWTFSMCDSPPKADIALRYQRGPGPPGAARRLGGKTAQISQGRRRFGRADGKGLGQHPSLDLPLAAPSFKKG
jgi:hypothetical protein